MDEYQSLNHTQWECLYHVIFIPKCRRRTLYVGLRQYLAGCAGFGTTIVDFRANMSVSYHYPGGSEKSLAPSVLTELPKDPKKLTAFPDIQYRDSMLLWRTSVSTYSIDSEITNLADKPIVLHWELAELTSSQQSKSIPLVSIHSNVAGTYLSPRGYVPKYEDRLHVLVPLSLSPGQRSNVWFGARYTEVFASGRLFGARYKSGETRLQESGVGSWLRISVPITVGEESLRMQITLTAKDAKARTSFY